jgi:Na+-transporting NADH:ubiquinone oxidoreductase subunit F
VAGAYLADYGDLHIFVNEEDDLLVEGGNTLLSSLAEEGVFIPSACGGKGTCAYCKVKVLKGGGPLLPTETPYLSAEEIEEDVRLSCQVKIRNDLKITIPEELLLVKEFRVKVGRVADLTPTIKSVRLEILAPEDGITFKAGQYIQLEVPKYKLTKEPEFRAYSISSSSEERSHLELVITRVPEGAVSTYVHDYLKMGDELVMRGPFGEFYLRDSDRDILLIATGSGLAPMLSILYQIQKEQIQRNTMLFFGARTTKDLYYTATIQELEEKLPLFTFVPTLSRTTDEENWRGERGRVTGLIEKYVSDGAHADAYLCGAPAMVDSCMELLKKKSIPEERIFCDKFE